jgi:hypothetical protein
MRLLRIPVIALLAVFALLASACSDDGGGDGGDAASTTGAPGSTTSTTVAGDACIEGEWLADLDSYSEGFSGFLERVGGPSLHEISGELTLLLDGERFTATFVGETVALDLPGGAGRITVITDGDQAGNYTAEDGVLAVTDIESTLMARGTAVIGGVETDLSDAPIDLDAFAQQNLFASPLPYTCEGDRLVLHVVVPDLDEEFTTGLDRVS